MAIYLNSSQHSDHSACRITRSIRSCSSCLRDCASNKGTRRLCDIWTDQATLVNPRERALLLMLWCYSLFKKPIANGIKVDLYLSMLLSGRLILRSDGSTWSMYEVQNNSLCLRDGLHFIQMLKVIMGDTCNPTALPNSFYHVLVLSTRTIKS